MTYSDSHLIYTLCCLSIMLQKIPISLIFLGFVNFLVFVYYLLNHCYENLKSGLTHDSMILLLFLATFGCFKFFFFFFTKEGGGGEVSVNDAT